MKQHIIIIVLACISSSCRLSGQEDMNTFKYKVGESTVYLLSEGQNKGNKSVLLNATPEMIQKTIPDGVFPNATNAFLVQTPTENILIDAGFGHKIDAEFETIGITAADIHKVFLTHMHGDHIGGLLINDKPRFEKAMLYIPQPEYDYWMSDEAMNSLPQDRRSGFVMARKVIETYRQNLSLFTPGTFDNFGKPLTTEIHTIGAYGHTPGHTMYLVESGGQKLLIWGDLTHAMAIQMPYPQVAVTYDVNPETAVLSRAETLKYVTLHNITIAGMHVAYPGIGKIEQDSDSGYRFIPAKK
ncbi:MAG: MBL fold metallo-hydrolase [Bacteroidales bacterium]|jgi:glyoxylase-like metal-dependent hydrolase (beta-lactamase superfamily II)|nr:MBL fold metallo-hydrolase [Bacteroidales bacterium]